MGKIVLGIIIVGISFISAKDFGPFLFVQGIILVNLGIFLGKGNRGIERL